MKIKICDIETVNDKVGKKYYLDLLDISTEIGEEKEN